jgi:hypothetical protein
VGGGIAVVFVGWIARRIFKRSEPRHNTKRSIELKASPVMNFQPTITIGATTPATQAASASSAKHQPEAEARCLTTLERYVRRLQKQDALIASATGPIPPGVSGELKRLFEEINESCPQLLRPFEGDGRAVMLRSQILTAIEKVSARIDDQWNGAKNVT